MASGGVYGGWRWSKRQLVAELVVEVGSGLTLIMVEVYDYEA